MQKNWVKFYRENQAPENPSSFADFVLDLELKAETLIDLGAGNGRDTYAMAEKYMARGVDPATFPDRTDRAIFARAPWQSMQAEISQADIVYSRFFLHTIPQIETEHIIKLTPKYFVAEARAVGDQPTLYPEHQRNYVDPEWLLNTLKEEGFEIIFYKVGRGLAQYKNEDPLVVRVIAKRI